MRTYEEANKLLDRIMESLYEQDKRLDRIGERLDSIGAKLKETAAIVNGNSTSHREIDKTLDRVGKRLDKVGKKLDKTASIVNGIGDSNGVVTEDYFIEATEEGKHIDPFGFLHQKHCNYIIYDEKENQSVEFDIVLTNEDFIFIIEVKYRLDKKHLNFFTLEKDEGPDKGLNKIQILKKYKSEWIGDRKIILAFASSGIKKEVLKAFAEAGYYVLMRKGGKFAVEAPVDKG